MGLNCLLNLQSCLANYDKLIETDQGKCSPTNIYNQGLRSLAPFLGSLCPTPSSTNQPKLELKMLYGLISLDHACLLFTTDCCSSVQHQLSVETCSLLGSLVFSLRHASSVCYGSILQKITTTRNLCFFFSSLFVKFSQLFKQKLFGVIVALQLFND